MRWTARPATAVGNARRTGGRDRNFGGRLLLKTLLAVCIAAAPAVSAHHGPGAYDRSREITVTGTVTRFEFVNPHVLIFIEVDLQGEITEWAGELTSPNRLARMGGDVSWHKDLLQPGDTVTLTGNPTHNGAPALFLNRVVDSDGRVLASSGR